MSTGNQTPASLNFLNHASFQIESNSAVLIVDPWLEGSAFNNSWNLIDNSTSNSETILKIPNNKSLWIWLSHEHSDHFSISFVKSLLHARSDAKFIYQKTNDKRVADYLRNLGFDVFEVRDGETIELDAEFSITTWGFYGDSYCLIRVGDTKILNLNDCAIGNERFLDEVMINLGELGNQLTFLFTQFGYANWEGNIDCIDRRRNAAYKVIERLKLQFDYFKPRFVIPFASFVYFSHSENFYMNFEQNNPHKLRHSENLKTVNPSMFFLKPGDLIHLTSSNLLAQLHHLSNRAELHWSKFDVSNLVVSDVEVEGVSNEMIIESANRLIYRSNKELYHLPYLFSFLRLIPEVYLFLSGTNAVIRFSFHNGAAIVNNQHRSDIEMSNQVALYLVEKEFGFDTLSVSARFSENSRNGLNNVRQFFTMQYFIKDNVKDLGLIRLVRKFSYFPVVKLSRLIGK